jgi:hypothetical protein
MGEVVAHPSHTGGTAAQPWHSGGTPVPLGAHKHSRGTGSAVVRESQPPSEPPASGEGGAVIMVSVLRWITP